MPVRPEVRTACVLGVVALVALAGPLAGASGPSWVLSRGAGEPLSPITSAREPLGSASPPRPTLGPPGITEGRPSSEPAGASALPPLGPSEGVLGWWNETSNMSSPGSPAFLLGGLAFDPPLQLMVFFGGETAAGTPTNATWEYGGTAWVNATASLELEAGGLPPAVFGMGFAWDPAWSGVLMTGGELASGAVSNQTWLFNTSGWHNETSKVSSPTNPSGSSPHDALGTMAYDGSLSEMVAVNGCSSALSGCAKALAPETYALGAPGSTWTNLSPTLTPGEPFPGQSAAGGFGAQMAYDPVLKELVYYGGENATSAAENGTWVMNSTGWYNISSPSSTQAYPPAEAFGAMTWDGQMDEIALFGGQLASGQASNATYLLVSGDWQKSCSSSCPLPPPPTYDGEMASNSSAVAALLVEGLSTGASTSCRGDSWVYEESSDPTVTAVSPVLSEVGVPVKVAATNLVGTGSGPLLEGTVQDNLGRVNVTSGTGLNFSSPFSFAATFNFSAAGTYTVSAEVQDFFYVVGKSPSIQVTVNGSLAASPLASPNPTELGTAVHFTAGIAAGAGVPPYTYAWAFGDGGTSTASSPTHSYTTANTYSASLEVTDHLGQSVTEPLTVTVYPTLTASAVAGARISDVGVPVTFTGVPAGGSGTYTAYHWDFGDGTSATVRAIVHEYLAAGTFQAYFNVTDSAGFSASNSTSVQVHPALVARPIHASSTSPTTSTAVTFNLTVLNGTPGYTYAWSFGSSGASTEASPTYTFLSAGMYTVTVVVQDHAGGLARRHLTLNVTGPPSGSPILRWLSHGLGLYTFAGALAAVAFLLVVFVLGRRRQEGREEVTEEPAGPESPSEETEGDETAPPREDRSEGSNGPPDASD